MSLNRVNNNYFYLDKHPIGKNDKKLIVKSLENKSPEKINELIILKKIIQFENTDNHVTIKADEAISALLANHSFTSVEIKHSSGEREVLHTKVNIQTLTAAESQELNKAVNKFLATIVIARQEQQLQEEPETVTESDANKKMAAGESKFHARQNRLRPSDYLKETAIVAFKSRKGFVEHLKEEEKKAQEHSRIQDEKKDARNREILKKEIQKREIKLESIKKEESI